MTKRLNWKLKVHNETMSRIKEDELLLGRSMDREEYLDDRQINVRREMERYTVMSYNVWETMKHLREAGEEELADKLWEFWEIDLGHEIEAMAQEFTNIGRELEELREKGKSVDS